MSFLSVNMLCLSLEETGIDFALITRKILLAHTVKCPEVIAPSGLVDLTTFLISCFFLFVLDFSISFILRQDSQCTSKMTDNNLVGYGIYYLV